MGVKPRKEVAEIFPLDTDNLCPPKHRLNRTLRATPAAVARIYALRAVDAAENIRRACVHNSHLCETLLTSLRLRRRPIM